MIAQNDDLARKIEALRAALPKLSARDQSFASDLIAKSARYAPSPKQLFWIEKLARSVEPQPAPSAPVESFAGVYQLFARARTHLKRPAVKLLAADRAPVKLYVASDKSRIPGVVNVTDGGRYGASRWYGRIHPDGRWEQGRDAAPASVVALVRALAADPAGVAAAYGRDTGACCFCSLPLTDERSVGVGYGPICAGHYGLPWGGKPSGHLAAAVEAEQAIPSFRADGREDFHADG